jgi:sugar/nucleoside kinase (ribokinase family)
MSSILLAIETATDVCSVALLKSAHVVAETTLEFPRAHAEYLVTMISDLLRFAGTRPSELDAIAGSPRQPPAVAFAARLEETLGAAVRCLPSYELAPAAPTTIGLGDTFVGGFIAGVALGTLAAHREIQQG